MSSPAWMLLAAVAAAASTPAARTSDQLIAPGAVWRYLDNGSNQGSAWRAPGYNDSGWAYGPAELGYGDGDEATVVSYGPSASNKYLTTYFRHTFSVVNAASYSSLILRLVRDDGAAAYLNGVELLRSNLPSGAIAFDTLAVAAVVGSDESLWRTFYLPSAQLVDGANVLAVEIHQSSPSSSDISLNLELVANTEPVLVRGPYLQLGTPGGVVVRWRTNLPEDSRLVYGPSPGSLVFSVSDPTPVTEHEFSLGGLAAATKYFYGVGTSTKLHAGGDAEHFFVTSPATGTAPPLRLWALGDSGTGDTNARAVRDAFYAFHGSTAPDLWLMLGDNAYTTGSDEEFQAAVFDMYPATLRQSVLWPTRGNHETFAAVYQDIFTLPAAAQAGGQPSGTEAYYSFDYANAHFVCLDSEGSDRSVGGAMHTWLQLDLASTSQEWLIAFWHHPPYSKGSHDSDTDQQLIEMRTNFLPVLEAAGVDLVLSGHSHSYERSFLLDGHYGLSTTLAPSMILDGGDGRPGSNGAYDKLGGAHRGAVYCVSGCSGQTASGPLNHPAMFLSLQELGSLVLDLNVGGPGRLDATFLQSDGTQDDHFTLLHESYSGTYCTAKQSSAGCWPAIGSSGSPSASGSPFFVTATQIVKQKSGILFYGFGPGHLAFQGGKLCVSAPITRTPGQSSGGATPCGGAFSYDFDARIQSGVDPALAAGATVYCQYWYRDPPTASATGLTGGLQFVIGP
jgi:calcineurin-like phosphoesterase family protein